MLTKYPIVAWTSFFYNADAWVKVSRAENGSKANNVVIRPSNLNLEVRDDGNGSVFVHVPYRSEGYRFSVEFLDNVYDYHTGCDTEYCDFVQDWHPNGPNYVSNYTEDMPVVSSEPHDALLIFASPFLASDLVPDETAPETYVVSPGRVPDLSQITNTNVYFGPGVYYMTGTSHAYLSPSVNWVYLAPGAYVKGAFEFNTTSSLIKATGAGVLSGEEYVYQANVQQGYTNNASNEHSLRMWSGYSSPGQQQTFLLSGPTTNSPPFNSVDFFGDLTTISIQQRNYKQVGAYFGQTDGTTLYQGSSVSDTFYHSNDDTIKTYGSNISVRDVVVWKGKTAPTIQFGWASRNLSNIVVDGVDIIHMRYNSNASHPSIIGANQIYGYPENQTNTADLNNTVRDLYLGNIRTEGVSGSLMRIVPLSNYENITIENVSLGNFSAASTGIRYSQLPIWTDPQGRMASIRDLAIRNFTVDGTTILQELFNYGPDQLGSLNIANELLLTGAVTIGV